MNFQKLKKLSKSLSFVRYNGTLVGVVDEFFHFIGFQDFYECFDSFVVFVAFFYGDDVDIFFNCIGIGGFYGQGVVGCVQACFQGVVSVDYGKVKVGKASGNLFRSQFHEFDVVGIFMGIEYRVGGFGGFGGMFLGGGWWVSVGGDWRVG